jgi:glycosyltransferase involved in cell wall biosynthesis
VSAVIICYNGERFVLEAIRSALAQVGVDLEVIVVDDGSTDRSADFARGIHDPRLRVIEKENGGPNSARNLGAKEARSPWIAFLDCDDWWGPRKLQHQLAAVCGNPDVALIHSSAILLAADGHEIARLPAIARGWILPELVVNNVITAGGSSALVRRNALEEVGWFDESLELAEEWECWMRIAARYPVATVTEQFDVYKLMREKSYGSDAERMLVNSLIVLDRAFATFASGLVALRGRAEANAYYLAALNFNAAGDAVGERRALRRLLRYRPFSLEVYRRLVRSWLPVAPRPS